MSRPVYNFDGSTDVTIECKAAFPGEGPCNMDIEVKQLACGAWVHPPCCADCGVSFDAESGGREWLIDAAKSAIDNDEPTEAQLVDMAWRNL